MLTFWETGFGDLQATFWPGIPYVVFGIWYLFIQVMSFSALLLFGLYFPDRSRMDVRLPWIKWAVLAVLCFGLAENVWYRFRMNFDSGGMAQWAGLESRTSEAIHWSQAICILLYLVTVVDNYRSASGADARRRLRILMIGSLAGLGMLLLIFSVLPRFGVNPHTGNWYELAVPFMTVFPLTLAYVLVVQRAMDVRVLVRTGTKYLLAKATLVGLQVALLAYVVFGILLPMLQRRDAVKREIVVLLLFGALPVRMFLKRESFTGKLQKRLDKRFFREEYNAELVLSELSDHMRTLSEKGPLMETVCRRISEVLHVPGWRFGCVVARCSIWR